MWISPGKRPSGSCDSQGHNKPSTSSKTPSVISNCCIAFALILLWEYQLVRFKTQFCGSAHKPVQQGITDRWTVAGGWYRNSEYSGSAYTYGRYAFYKRESWDVGLAVGAVTGYQRATVLPMAFPEACYGWVCALFAPRIEDSGANVIGVRLRIPVN